MKNEKVIRKLVRTTLKEFKSDNREVLVSYDISQEYNAFRVELLSLLGQYGLRMITESTYVLSKKMNFDEIESLSNKIIKKFDEIRQSLNENKNQIKKVKVVILSTYTFSLEEKTVIDEEI